MNIGLLTTPSNKLSPPEIWNVEVAPKPGHNHSHVDMLNINSSYYHVNKYENLYNIFWSLCQNNMSCIWDIYNNILYTRCMICFQLAVLNLSCKISLHMYMSLDDNDGKLWKQSISGPGTKSIVGPQTLMWIWFHNSYPFYLYSIRPHM